MEGFEKLTRRQQLAILNNPDNFIGLSASANASKGARSFSEWTTHQASGTPVNPVFRERMIARERVLEVQLQRQIDDFLGIKPPQ
jgi:hypothetical protein